MDRYPEHRFVASQAQQFAWLEKDYPLLFDKIRAKVHDGNFIPIGSSTFSLPYLGGVEHD